MANGLLVVANYAMLANMQNTGEGLMGAAEAARRLGVSKDTLIRMVARGDLEPVDKLPGINGAYLFWRSVIEQLASKASA